jgi:hypothetical protein
MLSRIIEGLLTLYGDKKDKGKSFKDSRFTSLEKMMDRGMVTCGAMTEITGTALRKFGIPTKMIHGILESQKKSFIKSVLLKNRHSWLEIYVPKTKEWLPLDPTQNDFNLFPDAEKIKEYHDWDELKEDYKTRCQRDSLTSKSNVSFIRFLELPKIEISNSLLTISKFLFSAKSL